ILFAFTLGTFGNSGYTFLEDIHQAENNNIYSAMLGGVVFNAANILFVAAIAITGMSVAFPIGAGFGLILGVLVNFIASPMGNPFVLFGGVLLIVVAIILSAISHAKLSLNNKTITAKGIALSLIAGLLFGFFYKF